ncbi:hypothetical protein CG51_10905 [Haematobacter missouriensis]|nr:hypothetical protein CG51_10905 [Haematobacter missouriensis]
MPSASAVLQLTAGSGGRRCARWSPKWRRAIPCRDSSSSSPRAPVSLPERPSATKGARPLFISNWGRIAFPRRRMSAYSGRGAAC